jgi:hypothetical protein
MPQRAEAGLAGDDGGRLAVLVQNTGRRSCVTPRAISDTHVAVWHNDAWAA